MIDRQPRLDDGFTSCSSPANHAIGVRDFKGDRVLKTMFALALAALSCSPALAAPGDMTVETFLSKVDGLMAGGGNMQSPDVALLQSEMKAAGTNYRTQMKADADAGRAPTSCPPETMSMDLADLMTHFRAYPESKRAGTSLNGALADLMKTRHPCKP
jgi:hypothetical protein